MLCFCVNCGRNSHNRVVPGNCWGKTMDPAGLEKKVYIKQPSMLFKLGGVNGRESLKTGESSPTEWDFVGSV